MMFQINDDSSRFKAQFLLALHSSTKTLGVSVIDCLQPDSDPYTATFEVGRELSNCLLTCVEKVLPASLWPNLSRLAVATGPGGFTGTRLTVGMARILSQQLGCPLDGVSSFALMAPRLIASEKSFQIKKFFWIVKPIRNRGILAGRYQLTNESLMNSFAGIIEIDAPHLLPVESDLKPALLAEDNVEEDVTQLVKLSLVAHQLGKKACWDFVLPIYPGSPVERP